MWVISYSREILWVGVLNISQCFFISLEFVSIVECIVATRCCVCPWPTFLQSWFIYLVRMYIVQSSPVKILPRNAQISFIVLHTNFLLQLLLLIYIYNIIQFLYYMLSCHPILFDIKVTKSRICFLWNSVSNSSISICYIKLKQRHALDVINI